MSTISTTLLLVGGSFLELAKTCVSTVFGFWFLAGHFRSLSIRLHTINEGRTAINSKTGFVPCTPNGCIELIKHSGIPMVGAKAVVLGKGESSS